MNDGVFVDMIYALDRRTIITLLVAFSVGLVALFVLLGGASTPAVLWSKRGMIVLAVNVLVLLLNVRPVLRAFHRLSFAKHWWFPWVDGEWRAELRSNWPRILRTYEAARDGEHFDALSDPLPRSAPSDLTLATVKIRSRLLTMSLDFKPDDSQRTSKTIFVRPNWNKPADPELYYIYEQFDPQQVAITDTKRHLGAAHVHYDADQEIFVGEYWTQRRGEQGFNTAGSIIIRRADAQRTRGRRRGPKRAAPGVMQ